MSIPEPQPERDVPSWDFLRSRFDSSTRGEPTRTVGLWCVDVVEEFLTPTWTVDFWRAAGHAPSIISAPWHGVAFDELVDLTLRVVDTDSIPGVAKLRRATRTNLTDDRLLHNSLQLEVAALARRSGADVHVEVKQHTPKPIDVIVNHDGRSIGVEAFVVLTDDRMRIGREYADLIGDRMSELRFKFDVEFDGELTMQLDDDETAAWVAALAAAADEADITQRTVRVDHRGGTVNVIPGRLATSARFTGPQVSGDGWSRTARRLRAKAEQAHESGATWLRVDLRDGLWQFTPWSQARLPEKTDELAGAIVHVLQGIPLHGVVATSGSCMAQGAYVGETYRGPRSVGLRRLIGQFRVRETIIVPLCEEALAEGPLWYQMYDAEPTWRNELLERFSLPDVELS